MTLRESIVTLIDFVREHGGNENVRVRQAVRTLEKKAEVLREKYERRCRRHPCWRCGENCDGILCWKCWQMIPDGIRVFHQIAKTDIERRMAARRVMEWVRDHAQYRDYCRIDDDTPEERAEAIRILEASV